MSIIVIRTWKANSENNIKLSLFLNWTEPFRVHRHSPLPRTLRNVLFLITVAIRSSSLSSFYINQACVRQAEFDAVFHASCLLTAIIFLMLSVYKWLIDRPRRLMNVNNSAKIWKVKNVKHFLFSKKWVYTTSRRPRILKRLAVLPDPPGWLGEDTLSTVWLVAFYSVIPVAFISHLQFYSSGHMLSCFLFVCFVFCFFLIQNSPSREVPLLFSASSQPYLHSLSYKNCSLILSLSPVV